MNIYRELPASFAAAVATIGNFDGVHRGHQAVIEQVGRRLRPWSELWIRGALVVQVFRIY